jgi:hypothetical protein
MVMRFMLMRGGLLDCAPLFVSYPRLLATSTSTQLMATTLCQILRPRGALALGPGGTSTQSIPAVESVQLTKGSRQLPSENAR